VHSQRGWFASGRKILAREASFKGATERRRSYGPRSWKRAEYLKRFAATYQEEAEGSEKQADSIRLREEGSKYQAEQTAKITREKSRTGPRGGDRAGIKKHSYNRAVQWSRKWASLYWRQRSRKRGKKKNRWGCDLTRRTVPQNPQPPPQGWGGRRTWGLGPQKDGCGVEQTEFFFPGGGDCRKKEKGREYGSQANKKKKSKLSGAIGGHQEGPSDGRNQGEITKNSRSNRSNKKPYVSRGRDGGT